MAQEISNALVDAAFMVRNDSMDVSAAIRGVEGALAQLRKMEELALAEMHGH